MSTSESTPPGMPQPIHVAFVWHMHQPYYRSARTGAFQMPWARLHALKDYLDMVEILADYPTVHQTFNLVPSLVEQLEDYAAGGLPVSASSADAPSADAPPVSATGASGAGGEPAGAAPRVTDIYWEHTLKPAAELLESERAFVVERMCERPDHPRAKAHPRYLELAQRRHSEAGRGWEACSTAFTTDELRDLQVWFNLAWFSPTLLETEPLLSLVRRGRGYKEEDKQVLARVQNDILGRILPAYRRAAARGQIELSTSPYFHPILPLLSNTDSARVGAGDTILPRRRFAHPEDAWEHVEMGLAKHEQTFGSRPRGMWCSEQAVGEDVVSLLLRAGVEWTISDQTVLSRSMAGTTTGAGADHARPAWAYPYLPYALRREAGQVAIVFRDHTLSDLVGFGYQSWDSRDAANDLLNRIRAIAASASAWGGNHAVGGDPGSKRPLLVTIALDGENAWEYYPHEGRDFLHFLYESLAADPGLRCVTISEHLREYPAVAPLDWLHTGSWIGGDLRTWSGDLGHNAAWDLLHDARDLAAARRRQAHGGALAGDDQADNLSRAGGGTAAEAAAKAAWGHIMAAEGSDWFWWFGEHHHTELDYVWDLEFRQHLQEAYLLLGEPVPARLYLPVLAAAAIGRQGRPTAIIDPAVDGRLTDKDGWDKAGILPPDHPATMQRAERTRIVEARFGWGAEHLYLLLVPRDSSDLEGLELDLTVAPAGSEAESVQDESRFHLALLQDGRIEATCSRPGQPVGTATGAWGDVVEIALALAGPLSVGGDQLGLVLRVGKGGMTDQVFRSAVPTPDEGDLG